VKGGGRKLKNNSRAGRSGFVVHVHIRRGLNKRKKCVVEGCVRGDVSSNIKRERDRSFIATTSVLLAVALDGVGDLGVFAGETLAHAGTDLIEAELLLVEIAEA